MSKVTDFYAKAMADESAKAEISSILGGTEINAATDEQLVKIGEVAKKLGFDITVDEAKAYLNPEEAELDEDDLDAVAGGKGGGPITCTTGGSTICKYAGGSVNPSVDV